MSTKPDSERMQQATTLLVDVLGFELDPWQIEALLMPEVSGRYYLCGPRQIGKSQLAIAFLLLQYCAGRKVLYLGHRVDTSKMMMARMLEMEPLLRELGLVTRVQRSQGYAEIYGPDGRMVFFRTRSRGATLGLTFDAIVWDEGQMIEADYQEEVAPTLSTSAYAYELFIGTPPTKEDWENGASGSPFVKARLVHDPAFKEFSSAEQYEPTLKITHDNLTKANPALTRMPKLWAQIQALTAVMPHEQIMRQYFGVWDIPKYLTQMESALTRAEVTAVLTGRGSKSSAGFTCSVGVNPDSDAAFIVFNDGVNAEVVERVDIPTGDLDPIIDYIYQRMRIVRNLVLPKNARGMALYNIIRERKYTGLASRTTLTDMPSFSVNINRFLKQVREKTIRVFEEADVSTAMMQFYTPLSDRSGGLTLGAANPLDVALMIGLVNSTRSGTLEERSKGNVAKAVY